MPDFSLDQLRALLEPLADPADREQQNRYFRGAVSWHGIRKPALDAFFRSCYRERLDAIPFDRQLELALEFLAADFAEEKLFGLALLHKHRRRLTPAWLTVLQPVAALYVHDWGTADTLASRVFGDLVRDDDAWAVAWSALRNSESLWLQRCACVGFLKAARKQRHHDLIFTIVADVIRNPARFAQLGAGWLLRDAFRSWPEDTAAFLRCHYACFSREALRYAIEARPEMERKAWLRNVAVSS